MPEMNTLTDKERQELVSSVHDMVYWYCRRFRPFQDYEDRVQRMFLAVVRAARVWRADKGCSFASYAYTAMWGEASRKQWPHGVVGARDIASVYLDSLCKGEGSTLHEFIPLDSGENIEEGYYRLERREWLRRALRRLPGKQADVIRMRILTPVQPNTLANVGLHLGFSKQRAETLEKMGLKALASIARSGIL